jgi:hypothetical protein
MLKAGDGRWWKSERRPGSPRSAETAAAGTAESGLERRVRSCRTRCWSGGLGDVGHTVPRLGVPLSPNPGWAEAITGADWRNYEPLKVDKERPG